MPLSVDLTSDTFFNGRIHVSQPAEGYRFSLDAPLLAGHISPGPDARIVDLGTGCGIIPLLLAHRHPTVQITGFELQTRLATIAMNNVKTNDMADCIAIVQADIHTVGHGKAGGKTDLVVCNPPFREARSGRINPDREKAIARHEIAVTLTDIVAAASRLLRVGGEFAVIYPAVRLIDLVTAMRSAAIEPKQILTIHSKQGEDARLVIVKGLKNSRPGAIVLPPLVIYENDGKTYTSDVRAMLGV
ncbi:MAG: methyltransferase [Thermodesulfobacteriota bacterium]|nr:methyltransferase [Thermodesulfobacteriota bacterium]